MSLVLMEVPPSGPFPASGRREKALNGVALFVELVKLMGTGCEESVRLSKYETRQKLSRGSSIHIDT